MLKYTIFKCLLLIFAFSFSEARLYHRQKESTGYVKWFNPSKGFGYIVNDEGGPDLYVHHTSIAMEGFRAIKDGDKVIFQITSGPKGLHATNVRLR